MVMKPGSRGPGLPTSRSAARQPRVPARTPPRVPARGSSCRGPAGRGSTQALARELADEPWLAFACGRYEGIDERVLHDAAQDLGLEVVARSPSATTSSTGEEVAVLVMVEAVARLLPGVIGNAESLVEESPLRGRPAGVPRLHQALAGKKPPGVTREVPSVLMSGDHRIAAGATSSGLQRTASGSVPTCCMPHRRRPAPLSRGRSTPSTSRSRPRPTPRSCSPWAGPAGSRRAGPTARSTSRPSSSRCRTSSTACRSGRPGPCARPVGSWGSVRVAATRRTPPPGRSGASWSLPTSRAEASAGTCSPTSRRRRRRTPRQSCSIDTAGTSERNLRTYRKAGYRAVPGEGAYPGTVDRTKKRRGPQSTRAERRSGRHEPAGGDQRSATPTVTVCAAMIPNSTSTWAVRPGPASRHPASRR